MKSSFRSVVVKATSHAVRQLKEQVAGLQSLIPIESAEAVFERMSHPNGAFRLQVYLAVPGPDLRVESTGYTTQEALLKMHKELTRQIQMRRLHRRDEQNLRRPLLGGK